MIFANVEIDPCTECGSNRTVGVELPWVYDGVLFWACQDCGHGRPRAFVDRRMYRLSVRYSDSHNAVKKTVDDAD